MVRLGESLELRKPTLISDSVREAEVEVVFGTPSRNCEGSGICMVTGRFPPGYTISCPHARAILYCDEQNRELVFRFPKRYLSARAKERLFTDEKFLVEEPFRIPLKLVRQWKLPGRYIPTGRYLIEVYSNEFRLYFPWPKD